MIAATYARESVDERLSGTGMYTQLEELKHRAEREGWQVYKQYIDEAKTGTKAEGREGLKQLMSDAKASRFDIVAVTKLDRFFRNLRLLLDYIDQLDKAGVTLVSIGEGLDTSTPTGRFTLQILGVIAEWERERIIERTKKGRHARYAQHQWAAGQPLYGYDYNPQTKMLEINETEASIVRRVFDLYVFERLGLQQIARLLNSEQVPPRQQATMWHKTAIRDFITHPGYNGKHPQGVNLLPIINDDLWAMAQQRIKDNRHLHRREGAPWLLQGMIKCGLCGKVLSCSYSHGKTGRRVYSCRGRLLGIYPDNNHRCNLPPIDAEELEYKTIDTVSDAYGNPKQMEQAIISTIKNLKARQDELEVAIKPVEKQLNDIEQRLMRLAENWVQGALGESRIAKMKHGLELEKERLLQVKTEIDPKQIEELEGVKFAIQQYNVALTEINTGGRGSLFWTLQFPSIDDWSGNPSACLKTWRQILDKHQIELWAYPNRVEVKGLLPLPAIDTQEFSSACRSGHCRSGHYPRFQRREAAGERGSP